MSYLLYEHIRDILATKGLHGLAEIKDLGLGEAIGNVGNGKAIRSVRTSERTIPLYAAVELKFEVADIATMMLELSLTLRDVGRAYAPNFATLFRADGTSFDDTNFLQHVVQAHWMIHQGSPQAVEELRPWLKMHTEHCLAALSVASPEISLHRVMEDELASLANGQVMPLKEMALVKSSELPEGLHCDSHLPDKSPEKFLELTGALNSSFIQKRLGSYGFWENIFLGVNLNLPKSLLTDYLFSDLAHSSPQTVQSILLSIDLGDFNAALLVSRIDDFPLSVLNRVEQSPLAHLNTEPAFLIMLISQESAKTRGFSFLDRHWLKVCFRGMQETIPYFDRFWDQPEQLVGSIMASQMKLSHTRPPLGHFMLWARLMNAELGPQEIDPGTANAYTHHMLWAFQEFKVQGHEAVPKIGELYDQMARSMRRVMRYLEPLLQYDEFMPYAEPLRADLVAWGMDIKTLGVTAPETARKQLEVDLGL
jgi:hypothetical protein